MSIEEIKCRKCRATIIEGKHLLSIQELHSNTEEGKHSSDCHSNVWFIQNDEAPDWINTDIAENGYTKGKLCCLQCKNKVGGFDYVSGPACSCSACPLPPIWILRNRVDAKMALPLHIQARLKEFKSNPRACPSSDSQPVNDNEHDDHMFDTTCSICKQEFIAAQRNFEFRGPVSHGDHVFDTSCDICRAVFLAEQTENEFEFRDQLQKAVLPVTSDKETLNSTSTSSMSSSTLESSSTPVQSENHMSSTSSNSLREDEIAEEEETDLNNTSEEAGSNVPLSSDDTVVEDQDQNTEWEKPFSEVALPEQDENQDGPDPEALTCSVCLELFYLPHWCEPCQHVFCAPCLRRLRGMAPASTKCPLCRETIKKCLPQHEMCRIIKALFPAEYKRRRSVEKRVRHQLPPLPGSPMNAFSFLGGRARRTNAGGGAQVLAAGAGVCFVVLLMMLGFTVFATTVGFLLWYMVEVSMDIVCDLAMEVSNFFDLAYQALVLVCVDGRVPGDLMQLMSASGARMLHSFTKLVNRTQNAMQDDHPTMQEPEPLPESPSVNGTQTVSGQFLTRMAQAQMANYVLVGFLVTYVLYRFAKHVQARRLQV